MKNESESIIDWLTYRCYEHNRYNNPHIPYYKWRAIFKDALYYEEIYENHIEKLGEKPC